MSGMQVKLPDTVTVQMSAQQVVIILDALSNHGPYKSVGPVIGAIEQQLLSQQIPNQPPAVSPPADVEPIAHHPV